MNISIEKRDFLRGWPVSFCTGATYEGTCGRCEVIKVLGLPEKGIFFKTDLPPQQFVLKADFEPLDRPIVSVYGQGGRYPFIVEIPRDETRTLMLQGGFFSRPCNQYGLTIKKIRCQFRLDYTSVFPWIVDPDSETDQTELERCESKKYWDTERLIIGEYYPVELDCQGWKRAGCGVFMLDDLNKPITSGMLLYLATEDIPHQAVELILHRFDRRVGVAVIDSLQQ